MKLQISENKKIELSNTSGLHYTLALAEDCPFGKDYIVTKIFNEDKLSTLLESYEDKDIEFTMFNDVFYIYFPKDNFCFYAHFPEEYIKQIKDTHQVVFVIKEENVEYFLYYDKIFQ